MKKLFALAIVFVLFGAVALVAQDAAPAPETVKVDGTVVVESVEGQADVVKIIAGEQEFVLLAGEQVEALLKVEKFAEKTFTFEIVKGEAGCELKSFAEAAAPATEAPAAPATEAPATEGGE